MTQAPFKLLLLPWVLEPVRICVCHLIEDFVFLAALWFFQVSLTFKAEHLGAFLPGVVPPGWGAQCGAWITCFLGRIFEIVITLSSVCHPPGGMGFDLLPRLLISL